jgi:cytochrome P450
MSFVVYGQEHRLNLVRDAQERKAMQADMNFQDNREMTVAAGFMFFFPQLTLWLRQLGIAPKSVDGHFHIDLVSDKLGKNALASMQSRRDHLVQTDHEPLMQRQYAHFRDNGPSPGVPSLEYILSDCLDNLWAGVSTTSDGLAPLFRYLSLPEHRKRQERLREEIRKTTADAGVSSPFQLSADQLKQCAYLEAVIRETLRLHPPIPFSMERIVTNREGAISVKGYNVPAGWKISSQAMYMQRQEQVFSDARTWCPERWIEGNADAKEGREDIRDMKSHFFAFGTGPRMCLGINVAFSMMRGIVAGVYGTSRTTITEDKDGPPESEASVVQSWLTERGRKVWLRFEDA